MGFFAGLATEGYDRQYSDRQLVQRIAAYMRPHTRRLLAILGLLLVIAVAGATLPVMVSRGVDLLKTNPGVSPILLISLGVLITGVTVWFANWLRRRWTVKLIANIVLKLRTDAFQAAASHDLSFYDTFSSGRIVSRITSDTQDFGQIVVMLTDVLSQFVQASILFFVLVSIDWRLTILILVYLPVMFLVTSGFRSLARTVTRQGMRAMANVNAAIKETVSGIAVAKNFRQEGTIYQDFNEANQTSYRVNVRRGLVLSLIFPSLDALSGVGTAILVYGGGLSTVQGVVTAGTWYLFLQSLSRFLMPIQNLSAFWSQIQSGLSAAERIFALIDAEHAVQQTERRSVSRLSGDIRFEHLCFHYSEKETVLDDFNLRIRPGETIALVGHTGAGKSSIAKLIARFYEYQDGSLLIDGQDIRHFDLLSYRRQLGIVSQTPFLFSGTVLENICYACPDSPDSDAIENLARQIGDGEWLEALPDGLQTQVGERGSWLSMGQRQLVALMRVLVHRPAIFILDEATASIDPFTEWQIQQTLNLILKDATSILIAHRLSTVKAADRIIVLEKGKIIEEGDHESLLARAGHYATLYNTYFRHQSIDYRPEGLDDFLKSKRNA
ncbi:MAG: ABC transporter ATP-binding protein [Omnitrophica WOR_2 bacterium]